ncbi:MAG: metal-activated pyridoxal enzyme [Burkholderiales bacterium]|jgi:D-serine deaminase-like pyridoxal phosphate-dependent protein|nr:metal-activated pyridoxal enzyme [Burkholderiales bacterium]
MSEYIGLHKNQLNTPVLVIDKTKLLNNIHSMQEFAEAKGIGVRPHAKTHKCSKIAQLQLEAGSIGICVTKVSEAYELAKNKIKGILITSPIVSLNKMQILVKVLKLAPDTMLIIDNLVNAQTINELLARHDLKLNVLLDIDGGIGRTGVVFTEVIEIAKQLNKFSNLCLKGIQCYAGHIQHIADIRLRTKASKEILQKAGAIKQDLVDAGIECSIQTGSGTGTFSIDANIPTVSEIQPGSYTVMDQEYSNIEFADNKFLPAMTMLTTVISTNQSTHVTVDAGTKAMYKVDTKPTIINQQNLIYDWDGFGDEHGKVMVINNGKLPKLGDVLELVVGHCDPTINLFDKFYITENDIVIDCWEIDLRGKCQ